MSDEQFFNPDKLNIEGVLLEESELFSKQQSNKVKLKNGKIPLKFLMNYVQQKKMKSLDGNKMIQCSNNPGRFTYKCVMHLHFPFQANIYHEYTVMD